MFSRHFVLLLFIPSLISAKCIWYGEIPIQDVTYNKAYNGPAKPIANKATYEKLISMCPHLDMSLDKTETCCDAGQIDTMARSFQLLQSFVHRCPACDLNLKAFFCEMTCGHSQHLFLESSKEEHGAVIAANLMVNRSYILNVIDSCRSVKYSAGGQLALDMICQTDEGKCQPEKLMESFSNNSPFSLQITLDDNQTNSMGLTTAPCQDGYRFPSMSISPCSCSDCDQTCPNKSPFRTGRSFTIFSLNGFYFLAATLAIISVGFVVAMAVLNFHKLQTRIRVECMDESTPLFDEEPNIGNMSFELPDFNGVVSYCCSRSCSLCCRLWYLVIPLGIVCALSASLGMLNIRLTTDPNILWSIRKSRALEDKAKFDSTFGPFYRTTQVILTPRKQSTFDRFYPGQMRVFTFGESLSIESLVELSRLQKGLESILVHRDDGTRITLNDVCYKPLGNNSGNSTDCAVFSAMEYFQKNVDQLLLNVSSDDGVPIADWASHLVSCFENPFTVSDPVLNISCMASSGSVVKPFLTVGGYSDPWNCSSLLLTIMLENTAETVNMAMAWEGAALKFLHSYYDSVHTLSYSTERSINDEISAESWADIRTISLSYLCMFIYVAISLSGWKRTKRWFIEESKIGLALVSIVLVSLAVSASIGLFALFKVPTTLLIFEVLPFLILAIGIDNIFILTRSCRRVAISSEEDNPIDQVCAAACRVGPGILMASVSEITGFVIAAALSTVYAVRMFAMYAAVALIINIILQCSVFVCFLYLDLRRVSANRSDIFCICWRSGPNYYSEEDDASEDEVTAAKSLAYRFIERIPTWSVYAGIGVFFLWTSISMALISKGNLGLDPSITVPDDSYLHDYLEKAASGNYINSGPPVFFVYQPAGDLTRRRQDSMCGSTSCRNDSVMSQLKTAAIYSNISLLFDAPNSWMDAYFDWLYARDCCKVLKGSSSSSPCPAGASEDQCESCKLNLDQNGRPSEQDFKAFLSIFLTDNPTTRCPFAGRAMYSKAVPLINDSVNDSYFMGYHTVLHNSSEYINALKRNWEVVDNANKYLEKMFENDSSKPHVYTYSVFYVYYEQYLNLVRNSLIEIGCALLAILPVAIAFTGFNLTVSMSVILAASMILINMMGLMALWKIDLNGVSLVNLVMSVGISVEFCTHIAIHFARNQKQQCPRLRTAEAFDEVGMSVFSGIGLTKLTGIAVLAFARSKLFTVFFFRMYLSLVVLGILHGLVFMPLILMVTARSKTAVAAVQEPRVACVPGQQHVDQLEVQDTFGKIE